GGPDEPEGAARRIAVLQELRAADDPDLHGQAWTAVSLLRLPEGAAERMALLSHQIGSGRLDRGFGRGPAPRRIEQRGDPPGVPYLGNGVAAVRAGRSRSAGSRRSRVYSLRRRHGSGDADARK